MGNSCDRYASVLPQVERKTKWKIGLIINICDQEQLYVANIRPIKAGPPPGTLRMGESLLGTVYTYYYAGDRVVVDPFDLSRVYEITLTKIPEAKIGGGRRIINKNARGDNTCDLIKFDEGEKPNFLREQPRAKNIYRSVDGRAPSQPNMKYPAEHPDDNIADDDE